MKIYSNEELEIRNKGLIKITKILDKLQVNNFLFMGVLLGAIREKDFIKWDWDVEIGCFSEELKEKCNNIIIELDNQNLDYELVDETIENYKINIFYKNNKYSLWGLYFENDFLKRTHYKFPKKHFINFERIQFKSNYYNIPSDCEALLEYIYDDWRTPKKSSDEKIYLSSKPHIKKSLIYRLIKRISDRFQSKKKTI